MIYKTSLKKWKMVINTNNLPPNISNSIKINVTIVEIDRSNPYLSFLIPSTVERR